LLEIVWPKLMKDCNTYGEPDLNYCIMNIHVPSKTIQTYQFQEYMKQSKVTFPSITMTFTFLIINNKIDTINLNKGIELLTILIINACLIALRTINKLSNLAKHIHKVDIQNHQLSIYRTFSWWWPKQNLEKHSDPTLYYRKNSSLYTSNPLKNTRFASSAFSLKDVHLS